MAFPFGGAAQIWRDLEAGLAYNPKKSEIRDWGENVEYRIALVEAAVSDGAYESYAAAQAAEVPAPVVSISVIVNGILIRYVVSEAHTALTTADGRTWGPAGTTCYLEHYGYEPVRWDDEAPTAAANDGTDVLQRICDEHEGLVLFTGMVKQRGRINIPHVYTTVPDGTLPEGANLNRPSARLRDIRFEAVNRLQGGIFLASDADLTVASYWSSEAEPITFESGWPYLDEFDQQIYTKPGGEPGPVFANMRFHELHPSSALMTRLDLIDYPPFFNMAEIARGAMHGCRASAMRTFFHAVDPVENVDGNPGGWVIENLEISAFDFGLNIEEGQDFVTLRNIHAWVFEISTDQRAIADDGNTYAARLVQCDNMNVYGLYSYWGRVAIGETGGTHALPVIIHGLAMDGDQAGIDMYGDSLVVSGYYNTSTQSRPHRAINMYGGRAVFQGNYFKSATPDDIYWGGGNLLFDGGFFLFGTDSPSVDTSALRLGYGDGGVCKFNDMTITWNGGTRTRGVFEQTGSAAMVVDGCSAPRSYPGGPIFTWTAEHEENVANCRHMPLGSVAYDTSWTKGYFEAPNSLRHYVEAPVSDALGVISDAGGISKIWRRARGTQDARTAVTAGSVIRTETHQAWDGADWQNVYQERTEAEAVDGSGNVSGLREIFVADASGIMQKVAEFRAGSLKITGVIEADGLVAPDTDAITYERVMTSAELAAANVPPSVDQVTLSLGGILARLVRSATATAYQSAGGQYWAIAAEHSHGAVDTLTRADLADILSDIPEGGYVMADGCQYLKMTASHPLYGTDPIPDRPGLIAAGMFTLAHWGVVAADRAEAANNTTRIAAADAAAAAMRKLLYLGSGTIFFDGMLAKSTGWIGEGMGQFLVSPAATNLVATGTFARNLYLPGVSDGEAMGATRANPSARGTVQTQASTAVTGGTTATVTLGDFTVPAQNASNIMKSADLVIDVGSGDEAVTVTAHSYAGGVNTLTVSPALSAAPTGGESYTLSPAWHDLVYKWPSFMSADGTLRAFSVAVFDTSVGVQNIGWRVLPDFGGDHGEDGYASGSNERSTADVDIGLWVQDCDRNSYANICVRGHWRIAGRMITQLAAWDGTGTLPANTVEPYHISFTDCDFGGYVGSLELGSDAYKVVSVGHTTTLTNDTIRVPWADTLCLRDSAVWDTVRYNDDGGWTTSAIGASILSVAQNGGDPTLADVVFDTDVTATLSAGSTLVMRPYAGGNSHIIDRSTSLSGFKFANDAMAHDQSNVAEGHVFDAPSTDLVYSGHRATERVFENLKIQDREEVGLHLHDLARMIFRNVEIEKGNDIGSGMGRKRLICSPSSADNTHHPYPCGGSYQLYLDAQSALRFPGIDWAPKVPVTRSTVFDGPGDAGFWEPRYHVLPTYTGSMAWERPMLVPFADGSAGLYKPGHPTPAPALIYRDSDARLIKSAPLYDADLPQFASVTFVGSLTGSEAINGIEGNRLSILLPINCAAQIALSEAAFMGRLEVASNSISRQIGAVNFRAASSPGAIKLWGTANFTVGTGDLTGSAGTAGHLTVSARDGALHVENQDAGATYLLTLGAV